MEKTNGSHQKNMILVSFTKLLSRRVFNVLAGLDVLLGALISEPTNTLFSSL